MPQLGYISTLLYLISSDKMQGGYKLPPRRYLDSLGTVPELYGLCIDYEYQDNGELTLKITDTYIRQEGVLTLSLTINLQEGVATGQIQVMGPSQETIFENKCQLRGIRCTLK